MGSCFAKVEKAFASVDPLRGALAIPPKYVTINFAFTFIFASILLAYGIYETYLFANRAPARILSTQMLDVPDDLSVFEVDFYIAASHGTVMNIVYDYTDSNCESIIASRGFPVNASLPVLPIFAIPNLPVPGDAFFGTFPVCTPTGVRSLTDLKKSPPQIFFTLPSPNGWIGGYFFNTTVNVTELMDKNPRVPAPLYIIQGEFSAHVFLTFNVYADSTLPSVRKSRFLSEVVDEVSNPYMYSLLNAPLVDQYPGPGGDCSVYGCEISFYISSTYTQVNITYVGSYLDVVSKVGGFAGPILLVCKIASVIVAVIWDKVATTACFVRLASSGKCCCKPPPPQSEKEMIADVELGDDAGARPLQRTSTHEANLVTDYYAFME